MTENAEDRRRRRRRPAAIAAGLAAGMLVSGFTVWSASQAAFSGTTTSPSNQWNAATISLSDNDNNTAMYTAGSYLTPSSSAVVRCIDVKYTGTAGSAGSTVKLYGDSTKVANTDLSGYLDLKIEIMTNSVPAASGDFSCGGTYGAATVLWSGGAGKTLYDFQSTKTSAAPLDSGWTPATNNEIRTFRFTTFVVDDNTANGRTVSNIPFTWSVTS